MNVFYFSGTGNSLAVAREIATEIGGEAIPITYEYRKTSNEMFGRGFGIVFPRYYGTEIGIPNIVKEFIENIEGLTGKYVFAICTYGGGFGDALIKIDNIVKQKGGVLSAGFGIHMPQNAFRKSWVNDAKLLEIWTKRKTKICEYIKTMQVGYIEKPKPVFTFTVKLLTPLIKGKIRENMAKCADLPVNEPFENIVKYADRSFMLTEKCNGCGICEKVCPVKNIVITNNIPEWKHRCENCLACFNWCPQKAIETNIVVKNYHYRNPEVGVKDFLKN
jgi:ferredoxin/flavodoxin